MGTYSVEHNRQVPRQPALQHITNMHKRIHITNWNGSQLVTYWLSAQMTKRPWLHSLCLHPVQCRACIIWSNTNTTHELTLHCNMLIANNTCPLLSFVYTASAPFCMLTLLYPYISKLVAGSCLQTVLPFSKALIAALCVIMIKEQTYNTVTIKYFMQQRGRMTLLRLNSFSIMRHGTNFGLASSLWKWCCSNTSL